TVAGAILHTQTHALPGRILTLGIMVLEAELRFKTLSVAQSALQDAAPTLTFIPETRRLDVAPRRTTPTLESLPPAAPDTRATFTPERELLDEAQLPTTRIRVEESPRAAITFTRARMAAFIATTDRTAIGRRTMAVDGSRRSA